MILISFQVNAEVCNKCFRTMLLANKDNEPDTEQLRRYPSTTLDGKHQKHPPNCVVTKTKENRKIMGFEKLKYFVYVYGHEAMINLSEQTSVLNQTFQ